MTKSQMARRRKARSIADIHNARSEREIAARIRAREELRYIPRSFVLYTPEGHNASTPPLSLDDRRQKRILRTDSLPEIITHLSAALKASNGKARRPRPETVPPLSLGLSILHHDYMMPEDPKAVVQPQLPASSSDPVIRRKGKNKERPVFPHPATSLAQPDKLPSSTIESNRLTKAWWLDVSSPSWEDMRGIGKLLHLHPLTLEDILQQDPREKLEHFPKLGYYFIVFRAIESQKTRQLHSGVAAKKGSHNSHNSVIGEGIVGEVNVYLVVFRGGICSFHFADIEEHVQAVRNKVLLLEHAINMSSDWIAHGLMDSIVDAFFPFLESIEDEVMNIEKLVFEDSTIPDTQAESSTTDVRSADGSDTVIGHNHPEKPGTIEKPDVPGLSEYPPSSIAPKTHFSLPNQYPFLRRIKRFFRRAMVLPLQFSQAVVVKRPIVHVPANTVQRMARTRRLVTSLSRFLAAKSEVVAQLQKRFVTTTGWGAGTGTEYDFDIFIYMGDVQDHILTLQQSLAHYERMLSQSHPNYLSHLRMSVSKAKSGSDKAIVTLTTVSLGVLCVQTLIGACSMNVKVPSNNLEENRYDVFGIVIALTFVIIVVYASFVRLWWVRARRRRATLLS